MNESLYEFTCGSINKSHNKSIINREDYMPEQKLIDLPRREQEKIKPRITDILREYPDGEMTAAVAEFAEYLLAEGMPLKWASLNGWRAKYNGGVICSVELPVTGSRDVWDIIPHFDFLSEYKTIVEAEGMQSIFWDNAFYCTLYPERVYNGLGCNPSKKCPGGITVTIFGKEIVGKCRHRPYPIIYDPDEKTIRGIKVLLELEKKARVESKCQ